MAEPAEVDGAVQHLLDRLAVAEGRVEDLELAVGALTAVMGPQRLAGNAVLTATYHKWKAVAEERARRRDLEKARKTVEKLEEVQ